MIGKALTKQLVKQFSPQVEEGVNEGIRAFTTKYPPAENESRIVLMLTEADGELWGVVCGIDKKGTGITRRVDQFPVMAIIQEALKKFTQE